jgi:site-specific recombinase XerD
VKNRPPAPAAGNVVAEFLADLARQGRSANTIRAYRSDLGDFTRFHPGLLASVTPAVLRAYLATLAAKVPATRARREAALAALRAIPPHKDRDRLLFTLLYATGMRIGEALAIDVDDLDLTHDDEHVTVLAQGGHRRTILLDDPTLVSLLRRYLKTRGYRHGPLFRAEKNHVGGPLRYASVQQL